MLHHHGPSSDGRGRRRRRRPGRVDGAAPGEFPLTVAGVDDEWERDPSSTPAPDGAVPWWLDVDPGDDEPVAPVRVARPPRRRTGAPAGQAAVLDRYAEYFDLQAATEAAQSAGEPPADAAGPGWPGGEPAGDAAGPGWPDGGTLGSGGVDDDTAEGAVAGDAPVDGDGSTAGSAEGTEADAGDARRFVFVEAATRYATDQPLDDEGAADAGWDGDDHGGGWAADAGWDGDDHGGGWADDAGWDGDDHGGGWADGPAAAALPAAGRRGRATRRRAVLAGVPMVLLAAIGAVWAGASSPPDEPRAPVTRAAPVRATTTTTFDLFPFGSDPTLGPTASPPSSVDPAASVPAPPATTTTRPPVRTSTTARPPASTTSTAPAVTTTTVPPAVTTTAPTGVTTTTTRAPTTTTTRPPTTTTTTAPTTTTTTTTEPTTTTTTTP